MSGFVEFGYDNYMAALNQLHQQALKELRQQATLAVTLLEKIRCDDAIAAERQRYACEIKRAQRGIY